MGWTIFEISTNVYQAFVMTMFLRIQMDPKYKIGFRELLCVSSITIFFTFYLFFDMKISDIFVFLIPFLYSLFEAQGDYFLDTDIGSSDDDIYNVIDRITFIGLWWGMGTIY